MITKDNTKKFMDALQTRVQTGLENVAVMIQEEAKRICPVDTGLLRSSITHQDIAPLTIEIGSAEIPYAAYVEIGTTNPNYPVQPYLRPALWANMAALKTLPGGSAAGVFTARPDRT